MYHPHTNTYKVYLVNDECFMYDMYTYSKNKDTHTHTYAYIMYPGIRRFRCGKSAYGGISGLDNVNTTNL